MEKEPYYWAYEKRYQAVYEAGISRWGHSPEDTVLYKTLKTEKKITLLKDIGKFSKLNGGFYYGIHKRIC